MTDDIEHLKVHKIPQPSTSERVFLPQLGDPAPPSGPVEGAYAEGTAGSETIDADALQQQIVAALKTVFDPEIPVNVYELGLIYDVQVEDDGRAEVKMTLTAPACPVAGALVQEVADKAARVPGVTGAHVDLVWDPPWTPDRMSEEAKLELGLL